MEFNKIFIGIRYSYIIKRFLEPPNLKMEAQGSLVRNADAAFLNP